MDNWGPGLVWTGAYTPGDDAAPVQNGPGNNILHLPGSGSAPHVPLASLALVIAILLVLEHLRRKAGAKRSKR